MERWWVSTEPSSNDSTYTRSKQTPISYDVVEAHAMALTDRGHC